MSVIDTLITNRTQEDVNALQALYSKPKAMWTVDEWNEFLLGNHRGAYNASDINRVLDALDYLAERVTEFGYVKPKIKRPSITEVVPGTSRLPEGYTELEYIESTGEQYIDTEVIPNQDTGVTVDFQLNTASSWQCIFGARTGANKNSYSLWHSGSAFGFYYASVNKTFSNLNGTERHRVVATKNTAVADGVSSVSLAFSNFNADYSLHLFASNSDGVASSNASMKLYSCQIYDNGTLVRDFVPAMNSSGEVGLYDLVTASFYGNAGSGSFVAGEEMESTGNTPTTTIVRDYYKIGDRPTASDLKDYLENVCQMRSFFGNWPTAPEVPVDIGKGITVKDANNIEIVLIAIESLLNRIHLAWIYSGEIYSGEG